MIALPGGNVHEAAATQLTLREQMVQVALRWQQRFGVAPAITSTLSEYDVALLVGMNEETYAADCRCRTAVTRGCDFRHDGLGYQVKANRPSGKAGSFVTLVSRANNFEWDRLVWVLYDKSYVLQEAWEWEVTAYRQEFEDKKRLSPGDMRRGKRLWPRR
jgi:hypothetical protein